VPRVPNPPAYRRGIAAVITRDAPVAVVMNDFYWKLYGDGLSGAT
jgi:hypothetical protein